MRSVCSWEGCVVRTDERWVAIEVVPGLEVSVLEPADPEEALAAAIADPEVDAYASIVWPASLAVARELVGRIVPGVRVTDLGAGTGLVALAAARLGATVTALDHDAAALSRVVRAARVQGVCVETRRFDVEGPEPLPAADLVVVADLLYEVPLARAVGRRVVEAVAGGARVLVGDPDRTGRAGFERVLAGHGLGAEFRDVTIRLPGESFDARVGVAWISALGADPHR